MADAIFAHSRLAPVYDAFEAGRADLPAYLEIVDELAATRVIDIGCGTGTLAVLLSATGRTVIGLDPAEESLRVARAKDPAGRVTWVHGDATAMPSYGADLALMTGNVAQVFLTDRAWTETLRGIRAALRPGGHLVFEARRPEDRGWEEWATREPEVVQVPGLGRVERRLELTEVNPPLVSFRFTYRFGAETATLTSDSTLRFRSREELEQSMRAEGFRVLEVRQAPDRPGREFVFIAQAGAA